MCPSFVPQVLRSLQHGALAAVASGLESNWVEGDGAADAQHGASSLLAHRGAASALLAPCARRPVRRSAGRMDASTLALLVSAA